MLWIPENLQIHNGAAILRFQVSVAEYTGPAAKSSPAVDPFP
jgi:hypothetical protein